MITALGFGAAYSLVGIALLVLGFFVLDLLTPGRLGQHLEASFNAGLMVAAGFLGLGANLFTVIWHNADAEFGPALLWTVAFGVLGVVLQALSILVLDLITPGKLREIIVSPGISPAGIASAASQLAVSAVICAAIA